MLVHVTVGINAINLRLEGLSSLKSRSVRGHIKGFVPVS